MTNDSVDIAFSTLESNVVYLVIMSFQVVPTKP